MRSALIFAAVVEHHLLLIADAWELMRLAAASPGAGTVDNFNAPMGSLDAREEIWRSRTKRGALSGRKFYRSRLVVRSYQRVRFVERSEIPQKLHVRLGQGRWLIEVRLIAEHCYSGVNAPALL
jgi:hypothetical protein